MRCGFCGYEFDPDEAEMACLGCPVTRGCHLVRCPRCGYEMPPEAKLITWLRRLKAGSGVRRGNPEGYSERIR